MQQLAPTHRPSVATPKLAQLFNSVPLGQVMLQQYYGLFGALIGWEIISLTILIADSKFNARANGGRVQIGVLMLNGTLLANLGILRLLAKSYMVHL